MARDMGAGPYNIDLYYSVAHANEFIDLEIIQGFQINTRDRVLRVIPFVADKEGFLTAKRIAEITPGATEREILVCGPPVMMKALRDQFRAMGVPNHAIHTEEFSMS
jgi:NAD(P)H-flavin reductase